jgi:hypothetical protein
MGGFRELYGDVTTTQEVNLTLMLERCLYAAGFNLDITNHFISQYTEHGGRKGNFVDDLLL